MLYHPSRPLEVPLPELPEVETIARSLRPALVGSRIARLEARWPKALRPDPATVTRGCEGRRVSSVGRRGKHLLVGLEDSGHLIVHLRMSGRFEWVEPGQPQPRHARTLWHLDDGRILAMDDARKFGTVTWSARPEHTLSGLGPEPLDEGFTPARFAAMLAPRRRALKPLLLDQQFLAGLGNIYVDESLHRAGLHPLTPADSLEPDQVARLHGHIEAVLTQAIDSCGTSIDWIYPQGRMQDYLRVYGRAGEPCLGCGAPIERLVVAQRGTWICPRCQPPTQESP
jgi:formamidopyrimidine-DNA glycosylase